MVQDGDLELLDKLFLRAPFYSFEDYRLDRMPEILAKNSFRNALRLASPALYNAAAKREFDWNKLAKNQQLSLCKYYNRMSFRPTPFGAFASFCLAGWDERDRIRLCGEKESQLHLLPSQQSLEQDSLSLLQTGGDCLLRTNPTLNRVGANYRFVKSVSTSSGKLKFLVNEIKAEKLTVYLAGLCAQAPLLQTDLLEKISAATDCTGEDARLFLDFLLAEQVLFSEHRGRLIAPGYWEQDGCPRASDDGKVLAGDDLSKSRFYAGLERKTVNGGISKTIAGDLLAAVSLLRKLVIPYPTPALKEFKDAFKEKFDARRVPLLQALDPDTGIGYGTLFTAAGTDGMLEDLNFQRRAALPPRLDWTAVHSFFLRSWVRNPHRSFYEPVVITDADAAGLEPLYDKMKFPPSLPVMFTRTPGKLVLDNLGGATALSLLGRFSVFSPEIAAYCKNMAAAEEVANPGVVFTEIHQLADTHVDNINRRVPLYTHVTDINTYPLEYAGQKELPLCDLMLSLHGEELWLESVCLRKRVMPRLPTAYNFHHNGLALFQMLCDLQFEGLQANLTFDLEKLFPGLDFYPRVEYGNVVISPARWKISQSDVARLTVKPFSIGRLHQLRQERGIPARLTMGLSDRQLNFNLVNDEESFFFLECLDENKTVTLREYLPAGRELTAGGKAHQGQYIAVLHNPNCIYPSTATRPAIRPAAVRRSFLPGSEWLYVKIYCTPESADLLLTRLVASFLKANGAAIRQWFFIRYHDPAPHIRLRIRSSDADSGMLLTKLTAKLSREQKAGLVKDVKFEIYEREIERYSAKLIASVEDFFCLSSGWALKHLENAMHEKEMDAFVVAYQLASEFFMNATHTALFFKWRADSFLTEFGDDKKLRVGFDNKYRGLAAGLKQLLQRGPSKDKMTLDLLRSITVLNSGSGVWSQERRYILLGDLLHMHINRLYTGNQRQHEALICYCLAKYGQSVLKNRNSVKAAGSR